ncbi:MAG: CoB--CoM heterodisulfide reductase iron-sulfur subunit A family protein [Anaerolineae bacterium]|nr:CoB--CoM heterodisulfide reductase iron-sulfur subunit A family protein [Anaerolineae bacterium]
MTLGAEAANTRALIIGAGIAGLQAALDIANAGYEAVLVDRLPSVGGHMAQLSETFPTLDCSQCILTPRTVEAGHHPRIRLRTYSDLIDLRGEVGAFTARIRRRAACVRWDLCTGCGLCQTRCPVRVPAEFEGGLGERRAIYTLSPQAVPNKPVIDREHCRHFTRGRCGVCERLCPVGAIDYEQQDEVFEEQVGAVIVATGYQLLPVSELAEYGGGTVPDVIDGLQFERLLSASGPTAGQVRRPSDGRVPKTVVFVQCAGSRDPERGRPHCSKFCCMYTAKHALLYRHRVHDGQAIVFYIDIRSGGKGYEEFVQRAMDEERVLYLRGKVSKLFREGEQVIVWGTDTLSGRNVEVRSDLVVLAVAALPDPSLGELARTLGLAAAGDGFMDERDPHLAPVETARPGIFVAGAALGPKDIPETVAQASAAAAKVLSLFARWQGEREPEMQADGLG